MSYLFYVTIFLLSYLLTGLIRYYAIRYLMDNPNERSSHTRPTPRGGGMAIVVTFYLGLIFLSEIKCCDRETWIMLGAVPIIMTSWLDDHRHVPVLYRLGVQAMGALWIIHFGMGDLLEYYAGQSPVLTVLLASLSMLVIVWIINLYNFMDGIDALAGLEFCTIAIAVLFTLVIVNRIHPGGAENTIAFVLLALTSTLGFLPINWPPARIFMGDVGSNFLGYLLAVMAIHTIQQHQLGLSTWLILPAVFWVDASVTLARRLIRGQPFYQAHRTHAYQHAARFFDSHKKVSLGIALINVFYLMPLALFSEIYKHLQVIFICLAYMPLIYLVFYFKAGLVAEKEA